MDEILFILGDLKKNNKRVTYGEILDEYEEIFGRKPNYEILFNKLKLLEKNKIINRKLGIYYELTDKIEALPIPENPSVKDIFYLLAKFLKSKIIGKEWNYPKQYWKLDYYMEHWGGYIR